MLIAPCQTPSRNCCFSDIPFFSMSCLNIFNLARATKRIVDDYIMSENHPTRLRNKELYTQAKEGLL